jgi:tRNA-Thr(GGU) m(6)t(6)A37 methyltransferase TsaA
MDIRVRPIGVVHGGRQTPEDDDWGGTEAAIVLADDLPEEALAGLETFSHAEILFVFHQVDPATIVTGARHPRNNPDWPAVGIFAQRGKNRPNCLGLTTVRVLGVAGRVLRVAELDAIDGTPVLDIKPVMAEFLPTSLSGRGNCRPPPGRNRRADRPVCEQHQAIGGTVSVPAFRFQLSDFSFSSFYPVLNEEYAAQIARDWNARDGQRGYVTCFVVRSAFLERYPVQVVGNCGHAELWVPAEELAELNANIVGLIVVIATFEPDDES